jgi:hypothetical protein
MGCSNRDAATYDMLENTRAKTEGPFRKSQREQAMELNRSLGGSANRTIISIVPVWDAVLTLRELVAKGQLPGVTKQQGGLFMDSLGHPQKPLRDLASYM